MKNRNIYICHKKSKVKCIFIFSIPNVLVLVIEGAVQGDVKCTAPDANLSPAYRLCNGFVN